MIFLFLNQGSRARRSVPAPQIICAPTQTKHASPTSNLVGAQAYERNEMLTVRESARIKRSADALWQSIGKFGALGDWHPLLLKVENDGEEIGSLRRAQTKAGDRQVERLEAIDHFSRCYRYTILAGPLRVRD